MRVLGAAIAVAVICGLSHAGTPEIGKAQQALTNAAASLERARGGAGHLVALGNSITAHEAALAAYRSGLREMAARELQVQQQIAEDGGNLEALLGALQSLAQAPKSAIAVFPGGPVAAMRGAGIIAELTPALEARVAGLRDKLTVLRQLRASQQAARVEARGTLASLQELRTQTTKELRRRQQTGLASREVLQSQADAAIRQAKSLSDLAASLAGAKVAASNTFITFSEAKGFVKLPVQGDVVSRFGEPDPWGRPGYGLTLEAPAYAQVTSPWDGTVRYAGPLIDYGQVVILEPENGTLIVIAGLAVVDRLVGETVLTGEPLGDLGGPLPASDEFLMAETTDRDAVGQEKLYIELRRGGEVVDPAPWFDMKEEGNGG